MAGTFKKISFNNRLPYIFLWILFENVISGTFPNRDIDTNINALLKTHL